MEWVIAALAVVILGLAALAAAGKLGSMPDADDDVYAPTLPSGELTAQDLRDVRLGVTLRGYDMRQVDALLRRLAVQLDGPDAVALEERTVLPVTETVDVDPLDEPVAVTEADNSEPTVGGVWNNGGHTADEK